MEVVPFDPEWLPQLAALARAHARLAPPHLAPTDEEVAEGLNLKSIYPVVDSHTAGVGMALTF